MNKAYQHIISTEDILNGSPRIAGRRLAVGDVVSIVMLNGIEVAVGDYELTKPEIKEALHYCAALQCKMDCPPVFCHNCSLRKKEPIDFSELREENIQGEDITHYQNLIFLGRKQEFIEDWNGKDLWNIAVNLLIDFGTKL